MSAPNRALMMASLEEIESMWAKDSDISEFNLVGATTSTPKLHQKYYSMFVKEKYMLEVIDNEVKKHEHYLDLLYQPNRLTDAEYDELGWEPLNKVPATAQERSRAVNLDKRMVDVRLKYSRQKLKVDYLKEIVDQVNQRQWHIRNLNETRKFENGG